MADPCKNCGEPLPEPAKFCPACGQSVRSLEKPWTALARELFEELLDIDGRMFVSLYKLFTSPGYLAREYNRGRRKTYTPPLRMFLVISLLFFFVLPSIANPKRRRPYDSMEWWWEVRTSSTHR